MVAVWDGIKGERLELRNVTFFTSLYNLLFNSTLCPYSEMFKQLRIQQIRFYLVTIPTYLLAVIILSYEVTHLLNQWESYV